jgi:hypothetical protein
VWGPLQTSYIIERGEKEVLQRHFFFMEDELKDTKDALLHNQGLVAALTAENEELTREKG